MLKVKMYIGIVYLAYTSSTQYVFESRKKCIESRMPVVKTSERITVSVDGYIARY